jgi:hypothetical protein
MKYIKWVGLIGILAIGGCSSSRITTSWKAEGIVPKKFSKIMVVGLIREADRTIQENMENHFVGDLKDLGYNAVSSLKEYGPKAFENLNEANTIGKIKTSGVDAVITIVLLDKEKERSYVPGRIFYSPYAYYQRRFWGYYGTLYQRVYEPGYYVTNTRYFWESILYDMTGRNDSLIYSVQTQSFASENAASLGHEYGRLIVKNMVKQGLLPSSAASSLKPF